MFLGEIFNTDGKVVGGVLGAAVGLTASVVAPVLGITVSMAQEALDSGCKTYEEIREFWKL